MNEKILRKNIRKYLQENPDIVIDEILSHNFRWPFDLEAGTEYFVRGDDCDGRDSGIGVLFCEKTGDSCIRVASQFHYLNGEKHRFRTVLGGTMHPEMRRALIILALAIKKQNETKPPD